jgi:hypothetical protein
MMDVVHRAYYAAEMNNPLSYYYALACSVGIIWPGYFRVQGWY